METQLKNHKLDHEFIAAVDGRSMSDDELNKMVSVQDFSKSQAGCMLSHCKVYAKMQTQDDEYALILEDDVLITDKEFKRILDNIVPYLNNNHITLLTYYWCRENSLLLNKINPEQKIKGASSDYFLCKPEDIHGIGRAGAYILSKGTAAKILAFHTPLLICQADSWIVYYNHKLISGVDCVYPMLLTENPQFGSEIGYTRNKMEAIGKKLVEKAVNMNLPVISQMIKKKRINFAKNYKNIILRN